MTWRHISFACPALLLSLISSGCDRQQPLAPSVEAASTAGSGPSVNAASSTNAAPVSKSRIDVSWRDNSTNETGFEVHRSTTGPSGAFILLTTTGANVTSSSDVGLSALTQYCYKVRAFKTTGASKSYSDFSNTACATTPGPPPGPSSANATPLSSSAVGITWVDNSATEDGFRVERSASSAGPWETAARTGPNVTSYSDGGRATEQSVCYRVTAFNAQGDSPASNVDCTAPPAAPTDLKATGMDGPAVDLAWTDHSAVEDGYRVERSDNGAAFTTVGYLSANSTSYRDIYVNTTTAYSYQVRAYKDGGFSGYANVASAETGACVPTSSTEICDNSLDDDCDGLIDASDPDCPLVQDCPCGGGYICGYDGFCYPSCHDGVHDGDETDVDCGGPSCSATCGVGQTCAVDSDCASGICAGTCQ